MKILLLSPWFPWPPFGGALIRVLETLRHLSQKHRVTLLAPVSHRVEAEHVAALDHLCETVVTVEVSETMQAVLARLGMGLLRGMPLIQSLHQDRNMARQLRQLTVQNCYDIIHVEHSFMSPYMAFVSPDSRAKRVLSMHNIESLRFRREIGSARWGARRLALLTDHLLFSGWEEESVGHFDGIVAVSTQEEEWIRAHAPKAQVVLIPNGVNIDYFSALERSNPPRRSIVFTGLMNYPPNIDAVLWFCDAVFPLVSRQHPEVRFLIVGDKPPSRVRALARRRNVYVTGRVTDVRPFIADCAALVVPLRSGAGTRLKILEALAMRRPVVSTYQGAEGLAVSDGVNILLGDTAEDLAHHLCALLSNPALGDQLGKAGRHLVESTYDWKSCLHKLEPFYATLTQQVANLRMACSQ
jgi:sugar transferase (PEP-CTERM/EpsH1 system associated)